MIFIVIALCSVPLYCLDNADEPKSPPGKNIYGHLIKREQHGTIDPLFINGLALRRYQDPQEIVTHFPYEHFPKSEPFLDNSLTRILSIALCDKDIEFKNRLLGRFIFQLVACPHYSFCAWIVAIIKAGASVNHGQDAAQSALFKLSNLDTYSSHMPEYLQALITLKADVNAFGVYKKINCPLLWRVHRPDLAKILLEGGAKLDYATDTNYTLLHLVAEHHEKDSHLLPLYIDRGLDVNAQTTDKRETPLHLLVQRIITEDNASIHDEIKLKMLELTKAKANLEAKNQYQETISDIIQHRIEHLEGFGYTFENFKQKWQALYDEMRNSN